MKRTVACKLFALFFVLVLLISSTVTTVSAQSDLSDGISESEVKMLSERTEEVQQPDETSVGFTEILSLREENAKHFDNGNGTYSVVTYSEAVHRRDTNGAWQDIDNALTLKTQETVQGLAQDAFYATNDDRVRFASQYAPNAQLFTLNENSYSISLSFAPLTARMEGAQITSTALPQSELLSAKNPLISNGIKRNENAVYETLEEATRIDTRTSIVYPDVAQNINVEYVLKGNRVKENIIVTAPCIDYSYRFRLSVTGLTMVEQEDGSIKLIDPLTQKNMYMIPAPYMVDAEGIVSRNVAYSLDKINESEYYITVTADADWINASGRAFPVAIDPTVLPETGTQDTYISDMSSTAKRTVYGSQEQMWVAEDTTVFIKNELPAFPLGTSIQSAKMYIDYFYAGVEGTSTVGVYPVLFSWNQSTLTWNLANQQSNLGLSTTQHSSFALNLSADDAAEPDPDQHVLLDITSLAVSWYNGTASNYGIALRYLSGDCWEFGISATESDYLFPVTEYVYSYYIPNGIYAVKNKATGKYLTVDDAEIGANDAVSVTQTTTSPATSFDANRLFKVQRVTSSTASSHRYVIRAMKDNDLTITATTDAGVTAITTKEISRQNAQVASADTFSIVWSNTEGYYLEILGSGTKLNAALDGGSSNNLWYLEQYFANGNHTSNVEMYPEGVFESCETITFTPEVISTTIMATHTIEVVVPAASANHAICAWDATTGVATLSLLEEGEFDVCLRFVNAGGTVLQTVTFTYEVLPNVCYIRNKAGKDSYKLGKANTTFLQTSDDTPASGEGLVLNYFAGTQYQEWAIEKLASGYCEMRYHDGNDVRTDDLLLTYENGVLLIKQRSSADSEKQKWTVSRQVDGNYKIVPKTNTAVCLYSNESTPVFQAYTEDTDTHDLWVIAEKGYASSVPAISQEKSNWCWNAAAKMFVMHYYPDVADVTQEEVAEYLFPDEENNNKTNTLYGTYQAIQYYLGQIGLDNSALPIIPINSADEQKPRNNIYSKEVVKRFLDDGHVLFVSRYRGGYRNEDYTNVVIGDGHDVLIYGYVTVNDDLWVLVKDPYPLYASTGNFVQGAPRIFMMSYEKLCYGFDVGGDEVSDEYFWKGGIAYNTEYANEKSADSWERVKAYYEALGEEILGT